MSNCLFKVAVLHLNKDGQAFLKPRWSESMRKRGLEVVPIMAGEDQRSIDAKLLGVDALLLPGGDSDVHPDYYQGQKAEGQFYDRARDETAFYLTKRAIELKLPTLAICRGLQEVNVALGGRLEEVDCNVHNHYSHYYDIERETEIHKVKTRSGSLLSSIFWDVRTQGEVLTNSVHNQGIPLQFLSKDLTVEAMEGDIVEAASLRGHPYFLAVQWHAEFESPSKIGLNEAIITSFVKAGLENKIRRESAKALPAPELYT